MIFIPLICLFIGIIVGLIINVPLSGPMANYLAISCLAGLDTICGGIRSTFEKKFYTDIFITGFVSNILIAYFLAWIGDRIGLDLFLAIAIILGGRIFMNLSLIRRYMLIWFQDRRADKLRNRSDMSSETV